MDTGPIVRTFETLINVGAAVAAIAAAFFVMLAGYQSMTAGGSVRALEATFKTLSVSPNGALVAAGAQDGTVRVWRLASEPSWPAWSATARAGAPSRPGAVAACVIRAKTEGRFGGSRTRKTADAVQPKRACGTWSSATLPWRRRHLRRPRC